MLHGMGGRHSWRWCARCGSKDFASGLLSHEGFGPVRRNAFPLACRESATVLLLLLSRRKMNAFIFGAFALLTLLLLLLLLPLALPQGPLRADTTRATGQSTAGGAGSAADGAANRFG